LAGYGIERRYRVVVGVSDEGQIDHVVRAGEVRDRPPNVGRHGKAKRAMVGGARRERDGAEIGKAARTEIHRHRRTGRAEQFDRAGVLAADTFRDAVDVVAVFQHQQGVGATELDGDRVE
jgi:hypothetical protein